jgi:hypothetical protein
MDPLPPGYKPNEAIVHNRRLGRLPLKSTRKALQFSDFFKFIEIPKTNTFWKRKATIPLRTYGNNQYGDCTRAKQAVAITRMERLEQRKLVQITDDEVIRVYTDMSNRLYGGGDNGAYEDDALNEWRNPETTIRDINGNPYTIDAYLRINPFNHDEVRAALALSGAKGIAVCFNLPLAWNGPEDIWVAPPDARYIGKWMPGSWGGHSMWMFSDYDKEGTFVDQTWGFGPTKVTWDGMAGFMDEAHLVIDSVNAWRKKATSPKVKRALSDVRDAVNEVSSIQIP